MAGAEVHSAPTKSFVRANDKATSADDYRFLPKPRAAFSLDNVRNLMVVRDPEAAIDVLDRLMASFGGCTKIKNLFELEAPERHARFDLLSLMVTVPFDTGLTYGQLAERGNAGSWESYATRPVGMIPARWTAGVARAVENLSSPELGSLPAIMHCEIQIMCGSQDAPRRVLGTATAAHDSAEVIHV